MNIVYAVVKRRLIITEQSSRITFYTNEAVFATEEAALKYIAQRKKLSNREDNGYIFVIEPWRVQTDVKEA